MSVTHFIVVIFSMGLMGLGAGNSCAQAYPTKPVRIVALEAGGGSDFGARLIAPGLSGLLGQPVIIENRAAAVVAELVAKAPPDGYTLLYHGSPVWIGPLLQNIPYDAERDFSPIVFIAGAPNLVVTTSALPIKSVKELIALAKARPGELNYATSGVGGSPHLAGELFKAMAGVNFVPIHYKGASPALVDLISGQVQLMFSGAAAVAPHLKSGRLKALAVTSAQPSALFPGVATVAASGLPGYEVTGKQGMWAPAKTPEVVIKRLNQEIVRVANRAEVKEKYFGAGLETVGSSPEEFAAFIKSEIAVWRKLIKDTGMRAE